MAKHGPLAEYVDNPDFCPECIDDATWMVAESLRRITKHPEYDEGFNPYCLKWQLCDDQEVPIYQGYAHFNSLNRIHRLGEAGRHSYFNCSEAGAEHDNWDFTQEDGGIATSKTYAVEWKLGGPPDSGLLVSNTLAHWQKGNVKDSSYGRWTVSDVWQQGRSAMFMVRVPADVQVVDRVYTFARFIIREAGESHCADPELVNLAELKVWEVRAA